MNTMFSLGKYSKSSWDFFLRIFYWEISVSDTLDDDANILPPDHKVYS